MLVVMMSGLGEHERRWGFDLQRLINGMSSVGAVNNQLLFRSRSFYFLFESIE